MNMEEKKRVIIDIMSKYIKEIDLHKYFEEKDDLEELNINSLAFVRIIVDIEKEFGVDFSDEFLDFEKNNSLNQLVAYIDELSE